MTPLRSGRRLALTLAAVMAVGCGSGEEAGEGARGVPTIAAAPSTGNPMVDLLDTGEAVFGIFSGEHTPEGGRLMGENPEADFVFYSLESGPFDLPAMEAYIAAMREAAGGNAPPVALRIPPVRDDRAAAPERIRQGLEAGAQAIVLPHVESAEDIALAAEAIGDRLWPVHADGDVVLVALIEDQPGIARTSEIVEAPGAGVVIPGPGDLRRAYEGDMEAVEGAIQTVLAACRGAEVPCGITAGVDDIGTRLEQGFRFIIVTDPEAIRVGKTAAGRTD